MLHGRPDYQTIQPFLTSGPTYARQDGANSEVDPLDEDTIIGVLLGDIGPIIPEDEPVFLIRSQDMCGPGGVRQWVQFCIDNGADPEDPMLADVLTHADDMEAWQAVHGVHLPDGPGFHDPELSRAPEAPPTE